MSKDRVEIIVEIAQAHDGSLGILHSYIDALADLDIDAIKFQTHIASAESSIHEPFRINFSYEDKTRYDYWKRMEFTEAQWLEIKSHCEDRGKEFLSSPFSIEAVELLERIGVSRYKIASGEVSNFLMLDAIAKTGKPMIFSSGLSSIEELNECFEYISNYDNKISLMQCTSSYPVRPDQLGLNMIAELKHAFNCPVGLSDHSGEIYAGLAAVSLGANMVEVHATFNKKMFGPDTSSSLDLDQLSSLVDGIRFIEDSLNHPLTKNEVNRETKKIFEKSLAVRKDLEKGHIIAVEDLESKKPSGLGHSAKNYMQIVGKKLKRELKRNEFINLNDVE